MSNDCGEVSTDDVVVTFLPGSFSSSVKDEVNGYVLYSATPNPTFEVSAIKFFIPETANVKLTLNDANGREIATLVNEVKSAGMHEVLLDAKSLNLSAGTYFYLFTAGDYSLVNKVTVLK